MMFKKSAVLDQDTVRTQFSPVVFRNHTRAQVVSVIQHNYLVCIDTSYTDSSDPSSDLTLVLATQPRIGNACKRLGSNATKHRV